MDNERSWVTKLRRLIWNGAVAVRNYAIRHERNHNLAEARDSARIADWLLRMAQKFDRANNPLIKRPKRHD